MQRQDFIEAVVDGGGLRIDGDLDQMGKRLVQEAGNLPDFAAATGRLGTRFETVYETTMSEIARITFDPNQCGGRPCVRGFRVRVTDVLGLLAAGASREEILADFPILEDADITAALEYAAMASDHPFLRLA